jgi:hypothetical protein
MANKTRRGIVKGITNAGGRLRKTGVGIFKGVGKTGAGVYRGVRNTGSGLLEIVGTTGRGVIGAAGAIGKGALNTVGNRFTGKRMAKKHRRTRKL